MVPLLLLLGVGAGLLSTLAGMGGGMLVVLALSALSDPRTALATTAPALLVSNVHRSFIYRRVLDRRVTGVLLLGAVPGALLGSLVAVAIPEAALPWILLVVACLAVARQAGWIAWTPPPSALVPVGFAAGTVAATSGASGIVSPVLLASGLRGDAFIGTASATAVAIHVGRILGYGAGGWIGEETLVSSAFLLGGLLVGNLLGVRLRGRLGDRVTLGITYVVLATSVALAVAGVT